MTKLLRIASNSITNKRECNFGFIGTSEFFIPNLICSEEINQAKN